MKTIAKLLDAVAQPYTCQDRVHGVYFLLLGPTVQYVGQAVDVPSRLRHHVTTSGIPFDRVAVLEVEPNNFVTLQEAEQYLIDVLTPAFNVDTYTEMRRKSADGAPPRHEAKMRLWLKGKLFKGLAGPAPSSAAALPTPTAPPLKAAPAPAAAPSQIAPPGAQFLRRREVIARTRRSATSIRTDVARGEFPRPVKLGARAIAWRVSDIEAWELARSTEDLPNAVTRLCQITQQRCQRRCGPKVCAIGQLATSSRPRAGSVQEEPANEQRGHGATT